MNEKPALELWLEPGALGRHDLAGVRDGHHLLDANRMQRERDGGLAGVNPPLELRGSANSAHEVDSLVGSDVADAEDRRENPFVQQLRVEGLDRIGLINRIGIELEAIPLAIEVDQKSSGPVRNACCRWRQCPHIAKPVQDIRRRLPIEIPYHTI